IVGSWYSYRIGRARHQVCWIVRNSQQIFNGIYRCAAETTLTILAAIIALRQRVEIRTVEFMNGRISGLARAVRRGYSDTKNVVRTCIKSCPCQDRKSVM